MKRKFEPFDYELIRKEMLSLPAEDHKKLTQAMKAYQIQLGVGYVHKNYGYGIEMLTDSGSGSGRCIFFTKTAERFIVLLVYKKESQKAPKRLLDLAKQRKLKFEEKD